MYGIAGIMGVPDPEPVPDGPVTPYVLLGDEAFPLKMFLMRPYSARALDTTEKKLYNFRHSKARMPIENTFGK